MGLHIVKRSSDRIIIAKTAGFPWAFGGLFVFVAILVILFAASQQSLHCESLEQGGTCVLERTQLVGSSTKIFALSEFDGARVGMRRDSDGDRRYRLELIIADQIVPMSKSYEGTRKAKLNTEALAEEINTFVAAPEQALEIIQDSRISNFLGGLIFFAIGFLVFGLGTFGSIRLCISKNELTLNSRNLFRKEEPRRYPLTNIEKIDLQRIIRRGGNEKTTYRVVFINKDGTKIPLTASYSGNENKQTYLASELEKFLENRPLMPDDQGRNDRDISRGDDFESSAQW